ncbi:transcriptional regulator, TetR family [Albimonas donghaensis]|uniref:Transcriptional regulator, TetR family n=1 Tax=Albimonas donghaensis TaxID=356660 RepID=A0A1H2YJ89_9RHOB|nr:TetR/AcrR family transcriptional regulator [Albimonas donghaensis]SDX05140.1 transcriptional regulator, TetR family [Albimonas donghaensis]
MARLATEKREKALCAALELFWRKGWHATSTRDLERALDMRPGSIYAAFGSKEGLFREALDRYAATTRAELEAATEGRAPLAGLAEFARRLGARMVDPDTTNACLLVKTLLECAGDEPELRAEADRLLSGFEARLAARFEAARAAGEVPAEADPAKLARRMQSRLMGLRAYAQRAGAEQDARDMAEDLAAEIEAMRPVPIPAPIAAPAPG